MESINIENSENKIQTADQEESEHEMFVATKLENSTNSETKESENEVQNADSQDAETIEISIYNSEDLSLSEIEQINGCIVIKANSIEKLNLHGNLKELSDPRNENINNTGDNSLDYPLDEPLDLRVNIPDEGQSKSIRKSRS